MRYLLDTHAAVWLLSADQERLPEHIRNSILYCEDTFAISEISIVEIIQLQQRKRIELRYRPNTIRTIIEENNIEIIPLSDDILERFFDLPMPTINGSLHGDPFDRLIIATALRRGLTLVSSDSKFPWYQANCGLHLLAI